MEQTFDLLPEFLEFAIDGSQTRNTGAVSAPSAGGRRASGGNANAATGGRGGVSKRQTPNAVAGLTRGQKAAATRRANAEKAAKNAAKAARAEKRAARKAAAEKAAKKAARAAKGAATRAANKAANKASKRATNQ